MQNKVGRRANLHLSLCNRYMHAAKHAATSSCSCHFQDEGFRDPNTGEIRRVPFEIRVEGDKQPIYEETLEDVRRFNENPALPFNAFGTLALARAEFDANSGSSQVFFLLKVKLFLLKPMFEIFITSCISAAALFALVCIASEGL